jgi:hypothetical protein
MIDKLPTMKELLNSQLENIHVRSCKILDSDFQNTMGIESNDLEYSKSIFDETPSKDAFYGFDAFERKLTSKESKEADNNKLHNPFYQLSGLTELNNNKRQSFDGVVDSFSKLNTSEPVHLDPFSMTSNKNNIMKNSKNTLFLSQEQGNGLEIYGTCTF